MLRVAPQGKGVRATLEDGTEAYADVLVGADGIWSSVRKQMFGLEEVRSPWRAAWPVACFPVPDGAVSFPPFSRAETRKPVALPPRGPPAARSMIRRNAGLRATPCR